MTGKPPPVPRETSAEWRARTLRETEGMTTPAQVLEHLKADYEKHGPPPKPLEEPAS